MKIVNFSMIKKIITSIIFISAIVTGLYFVFTYKEEPKNDLQKFTDLISATAGPTSSSTTTANLTGVIGSNKPVKGKIFFDSLEVEINGTSFSTTKLSPGYYGITVQDSEGKSYLTSPTSIQVFPGKNDIKISVFN